VIIVTIIVVVVVVSIVIIITEWCKIQQIYGPLFQLLDILQGAVATC